MNSSDGLADPHLKQNKWILDLNDSYDDSEHICLYLETIEVEENSFQI